MNIVKKVYCRTFQLAFKIAMPILPYREPKILQSMRQAALALQDKGVGTVLIVTDKGVAGRGLMDSLLAELDKMGIRQVVFDETVPNPTVRNVETARALYLREKCQGLIAMGGGSVIDCAKAVGARLAKPKQPLAKMGGILKVHRKLPPLVAIPTTAGTGSEATVTAVITDEKTHHKCPINDFTLVPEYAVLDPHVTQGLPKNLTATTGMDALTHAVEAYIGRNTTKLTRAMSEEAVLLIKDYLKRAYEDGNDEEARAKMMRAAYCAGVAFTRSYVGYVHGVAHSLGGQYATPHGLASAVILPYFLEEYGRTCRKPLGRLARLCDLAGFDDDDESASEQFIAWVKEMNRFMEIPDSLGGIRTEDIPIMARHADKECNPLYPVPKLMDAKELEKMYYRIRREGKKV